MSTDTKTIEFLIETVSALEENYTQLSNPKSYTYMYQAVTKLCQAIVELRRGNL